MPRGIEILRSPSIRDATNGQFGIDFTLSMMPANVAFVSVKTRRAVHFLAKPSIGLHRRGSMDVSNIAFPTGHFLALHSGSGNGATMAWRRLRCDLQRPGRRMPPL